MCNTDNEGSEFFVMFIQNEGDPISLELFALTSRTPTTVTFEAPWIRETKVLTTDTSQVAVYTPVSYVAGVGSQLGFSGVSVSSTADVAVFGISSSPTTCGGFMVLPVDTLGTEYYTVTSEPEIPSGNRFPEIGVVGTAENTDVQVRLPSLRRVRILYGGRTYTSGQTIRVRLNKHETLQLQEQNYNDLTGTYITANKRIAVFSGNVLADISVSGSSGRADHVVAQIPPVFALGKTFGIVPFPNRAAFDVIKIVASQPNTQVTITGSPEILLQNAGDFDTRAISSAQPIFLSSTKPILVAQFVESAKRNDFGSPSVVLVPPAEQYRNYYVFSVSPNATFDNYLLLVVNRRHITGIEVDGDVVSPVGWTPMSGTSLVAKSVLLRKTGTRHYVRHTTDRNARFGAYVYGHSEGQCTYAYTAGACSDGVAIVSEHFSLLYFPALIGRKIKH